MEKNAFSLVRLVRNFIHDDVYSLYNYIFNNNNNLTENLTKPNQGLEKRWEIYNLDYHNENDISYEKYTLHYFMNDILIIEYNPFEYNLSDKKGDQGRHLSFDELYK
ncbi:MAG: hypothetical protein ACP5L4_01915 [Thermoplasmata archaeon]